MLPSHATKELNTFLTLAFFDETKVESFHNHWEEYGIEAALNEYESSVQSPDDWTNVKVMLAHYGFIPTSCPKMTRLFYEARLIRECKYRGFPEEGGDRRWCHRDCRIITTADCKSCVSQSMPD
jgi:hypothetical protein